jgi:putative membrane protein
MIKKILKYALLSYFSLITTNYLWGNLPNNLSITLQAGFVLSLFEIILKPIVKLLLLPINILTLGLFRSIINVLGLYLTLYLVPQFQVNDISTTGFSWQGFLVPPFEFTHFFAVLVSSLTFSTIFYLFKAICSKR